MLYTIKEQKNVYVIVHVFLYLCNMISYRCMQKIPKYKMICQ